MNLPARPFRETSPIRLRIGKAARLGGCLMAGLLLAGCATPEKHSSQSKSAGRPQNVFLDTKVLPASLRRVAVLPLACEESAAALSDSCDTLRPGLMEELLRTRKFEVVSVNPEILRRRTGRADWTGAETLPVDFFSLLQRQYGCDAVFFCQLTTFRAYAPLTIGWRMKLVDARTQQIIWAADEVFDTKQPAVGVGAWLVEQGRQMVAVEFTDEWAVLNSPTRFGRYSASQLLATLPER